MSESPHYHLVQCVRDDTAALLRRFLEQEEVPAVIPLTSADRECEDHFTATCNQQQDGRYEVRLPLRNSEDRMELGESKRVAHASLSRLEK